jgi:GntR family transcriptional regulator/MocR family aminotransferase
MEDPGYDGIRQIFINHGFKMNYIPVEDDGISLDKLKRTNTDLLYVTPSHQFPTGAVMSIGKRKELLQWAEDTDTYLIGDDYDSELRYYTNPIPSLQSLDEFNRTIYTGTFSKSLAPSMRLAYIVFPKPLMARYSEYYWRYNAQVTPFHQLTLADFIESGNYERLINRLRTKYKKKQDSLITAIEKIFGDKVKVSSSGAGIQLLINVNSHLTQEELVAKALEHGIKVYSTDVLYMDKTLCPKSEIQLGFPTVPQEEFEEIMQTLKSIWITE